jgi:predicted TIM-barrel fold metal-dependent hydrolase
MSAAPALPFAIPAGATDCHSHVVGAPARWPQLPDRRYEPEQGPPEDYVALMARLGIARSVLVQPSIYGTDNGCQLEAMRLIGPARSRGIAVVAEDVDDLELQRLHDAGMRGLRFNLKSGGLGLAALEPVARKIAPLGWHIQLFTATPTIAEIAPRLRALAVPVVFDHMGGPVIGEGLAQPGFQALLGLLRERRAWVKLSGAERLSAEPAGYDDVVPFARALINDAADRALWGLDWPPSRFFKTKPDDAHWFRLLATWAPDAATRQAILVDNPARLYGFG